ncbi:hypothetical protein [Streptomyces venezuelae]|uniref:nSTAND1 domain-containing NTPase n=1 Tax=Streptomyces venezuelae TaxID=54571 RepID=UPI00364D3E81
MGRREKPIDPGAGPVQRFACELRKLRREADSPTYREMAQGATYSTAALARAAAGETLPSLPLTLAYVRACDGDPVDWEQRWHAARAEEANRPRDMAEEAADPPYRGLARFEPDDHARFFGRTRLTDNLTALARDRRCVIVLGPSGSGKSSLLRAGLIPRLRTAEDPALRPAAIRILTPGPRPARTHRELFTPAPGTGDTWLLVDQFEETFTLCRDPKERREFIDLLLSARRADSGLRVVVGVRADFYARCLEYEGLVAVIGEASLPVGPMTADELREVIVKPAAAEGLIVERALTARLIEETGEEPGALPLLSHTLLETWRRRHGRALTLEGYETAGGIHGAIAQTAEDLYTRLTPPQAETARHILLRLITPGEGTPDTRRPIARTELATAHCAVTGEEQARGTSPAPNPDTAPAPDTARALTPDTAPPPDRPPTTDAAPDAVLQQLARARLVTLDDNTVDLAHEALITAWPRLHRWIEDDRERLCRHRRLTDASHNWHARRRDSGALLRGAALAEAQDAFGTPAQQGELSALERGLLHQSMRAARQRIRRGRQFMAAVSVLLVLAMVATAVAVRKSAVADSRRREAYSRELADRAARLSGERPEAAMLLALKGYRQAPTTEARGGLLNAYSRFYANQFTDHSQPVTGLAFARDGRTLATASPDHSVKLWDTRSRRLLATLNGHTDLVNTVAFSPDGRTLASAGNDRSIKLWDVRTRRLLATLTGHTNTVEDAAFSPDGRTLASAASDRTVRLWNVRTHRERAVLTGHTDEVMRLAYAPDGRTLASADTSRTTRLWDMSAHTSSRTASHTSFALPAGDTGATNAVAFAPDGRTLATASTDHKVKLWNVRSRRLTATLGGPREDIQELAFAPDGRTLAGASLDGTVRLWRPRARTALATLNVAEPVFALAFSSDGRTLASTGKGTTVRLWDVATRHPATLTGRTGTTTADAPYVNGRSFLTVDHDNLVTRWSSTPPRAAAPSLRVPRNTKAAVVGGDGRVLATVDSDGVIRVGNLTTGQHMATLPQATASATEWRVSMTPDGRTLAVTGNDGTIRIWDVGARHPTAVLHSSDSVLGLALRPDGRALASVSSDGTTRLWTIGSKRTGTPLPGPKDATRILSFSPDGRTLAVGNTDNSVRLWDAVTRRATATLTTNDGLTRAMAFSPDGSALATTASDGTLRLWSTRTARLRAALTGSEAVGPVRFSPDGHALATIASGGTAHAWSTDPDYVATQVCRLSRLHHWAGLLPDQPVRDLCP